MSNWILENFSKLIFLWASAIKKGVAWRGRKKIRHKIKQKFKKSWPNNYWKTVEILQTHQTTWFWQFNGYFSTTLHLYSGESGATYRFHCSIQPLYEKLLFFCLTNLRSQFQTLLWGRDNMLKLRYQSLHLLTCSAHKTGPGKCFKTNIPFKNLW